MGWMGWKHWVWILFQVKGLITESQGFWEVGTWPAGIMGYGYESGTPCGLTPCLEHPEKAGIDPGVSETSKPVGWCLRPLMQSLYWTRASLIGALMLAEAGVLVKGLYLAFTLGPRVGYSQLPVWLWLPQKPWVLLPA